MSDTFVAALLGNDPDALREDVSLATPLTLPRIAGRVQVVAALRAYAEAMGATDADLLLPLLTATPLRSWRSAREMRTAWSPPSTSTGARGPTWPLSGTGSRGSAPT
jgi:hypothetical protein